MTAYWIDTFRSISDQAKLEAYIAPGSTPGKPCSTPPSWPPPDDPFCPYQERPHVEEPGRPAATARPHSQRPHSSPVNHPANAGQRIQAQWRTLLADLCVWTAVGTYSCEAT